MIKDKKIGMIVAASHALSYKKTHPSADAEEIFKHVIDMIKKETETKIFGIAGANFVVKYLEKHPNATEKEVMQHLVNNTDSILSSIENQELQY